MASVHSRVNIDEVLRKASDAKIGRFKVNLLDELKRRAPRVTGALADSIRLEVNPTGSKLNIVVRVPYAEPVIKGAKPHDIYGAPLVFNWAKRGGMKVFVLHVNHPGNKPNDQWIQDAVQEAIRITR